MQSLVSADGFTGPGSLSEQMGVFIGIQHMEYGSLGASHLRPHGPYAVTGSQFSVAAGRMSFNYGLKGAQKLPCSMQMLWFHSIVVYC